MTPQTDNTNRCGVRAVASLAGTIQSAGVGELGSVLASATANPDLASILSSK